MTTISFWLRLQRPGVKLTFLQCDTQQAALPWENVQFQFSSSSSASARKTFFNKSKHIPSVYACKWQQQRCTRRVTSHTSIYKRNHDTTTRRDRRWLSVNMQWPLLVHSAHGCFHSCSDFNRESVDKLISFNCHRMIARTRDTHSCILKAFTNQLAHGLCESVSEAYAVASTALPNWSASKTETRKMERDFAFLWRFEWFDFILEMKAFFSVQCRAPSQPKANESELTKCLLSSSRNFSVYIQFTTDNDGQTTQSSSSPSSCY